MSNFRVIFSLFFRSLLVLLCYPSGAHSQLSSSESRILLQIQQQLEYPDALKGWNNWTDFCYLSPSPSVSVVCSGTHVTELTIVGDSTNSHPNNNTSSTPSLSNTFSIESFFTVVTKLTSLKKLSLVSLGLWGPLPSKIDRLSSLQLLNLTSNSISGDIPSSISSLKSLKTLILSRNLITSTSPPDLTGLLSLQELDLGYNRLGPEFPSLSTGLVSVVLKNNLLRSQIPTNQLKKKLNSLQRLDLSSNHLVGQVPAFLFSLPVLWYLNLSGNQFTGSVPKGVTCGGKLWLVDISNNLLTGTLPSCIGSKAGQKKVFVSWNCLSGIKYQHRVSFCEKQAALAVEPPDAKNNGKTNKDQGASSGVKLAVVLALVAGIVIIFGIIIGLLLWAICRKRRSNNAGEIKMVNKPAASVLGKSPVQATTPTSLGSKYLPTTLRMSALSLPSYYAFTPEELKAATNHFDPENLIADEGSQGQLYKGLLQSGSAVLIRSIKLKQKHSSKILKQHMEVISQLRNQNLVSVIGHCVVNCQNNRSNKGTSTIFVIFEYVSNGSLREHLTDWRRKDVLKWPQRMTISMGIARGVHYLHGGVAPGVFGNDLKIDKILLDETLTPKVDGFRIPLPPKEEPEIPPSAEKDDIHKLGVILLEIITGKQITSGNQVAEFKLELERSLIEPASAMHQTVDPVLRGTFAYQSVRTAVEITINCLNKDPSQRPSMEDVLWYLQYSIQAQQAWTTSGNLGMNSGNIGLHLQK